MLDIINKDISENLSEFQFRRGDKILIKELAACVKNAVDTLGIKHFVPAECKREMDTLTNKIENISINQPNQVNPTQNFLKRLIATADRNSNRNQHGYRYDRSDMLFASYLRMITGPLSYNTIQKNLEAALPSLPSTNRYIRKFNCHITECILRCAELKVYLEERNLQFVLSLSEDATRIVDRVQISKKLVCGSSKQTISITQNICHRQMMNCIVSVETECHCAFFIAVC